MIYQVSAVLSASSPLMPDMAAPLSEHIPKIGSGFRDSPCNSCWRPIMKTELCICYLYARGPSPACVSYLVGGSVPECPQGYRLVEFLCLPVSSYPHQGLQSFLKLFHKSLQGPFHVQLWISASVSVSNWLKPLNGQLCKAPVWEHNRVSLIMS